MAWKWYGVKTVFRTETKGRPTSVDSLYDADATLVEERILLIRARSFDDAIAKAESEAKLYEVDTHSNFYGQTVKTRYLNACDAFELFDEPGSNVEIYSATELVPKSVSDCKVVDQHLGRKETKIARQTRKKFLNAHLPSIPKK